MSVLNYLEQLANSTHYCSEKISTACLPVNYQNAILSKDAAALKSALTNNQPLADMQRLFK